MKIALIGHGAMGKLIERLAPEKHHEISIVIHDADAHLTAGELAEKLNGASAAIDFTVAAAVRRNVEACVMAKVPLVEGTTGWHGELESLKNFINENNGAMIHAGNFSLGVNLFYRVADFAAELFAKFDAYETFIEEQHHSRKLDAPSGTALKLQSIIAAHYEKDFSVSSTRAGHIPGTHRVGFDSAADQILLEHTARSREGFAAGAILAAEWISGKTGVYEFTEAMDEIIKSQYGER